MIITQRGVLPPVNFLELDASLQASMLGPAGTREIAFVDLNASLESSILGPAGARLITAADLDVLTGSILSTAASAIQLRGVTKVISFRNADGSVVEGTIGTDANSDLHIQPLNGNALRLFSDSGTARVEIPAGAGATRVHIVSTATLSDVRSAAIRELAYCHVGSDGTLQANSFNVVSSVRNSVGSYTVTLTTGIFGTKAIPVANPINFATIINSQAATLTSITVVTADATGTLADAAFNLIVMGV